MTKSTHHPLSPPPLDELANTIRLALEKNYRHSTVNIVTCPDLTQTPWDLAAPGLSGNETIADIGGQAHLFPRPLFDNKYSLLECADIMQLSAENGMLIGAGAGPFHVLGTNSELAPNLSWKAGCTSIRNKTRYAKIIDGETKDKLRPICRICPSTDCALMMNLFGSRGEQGPVLKITARSRKGAEKSLTECVQRALRDTYGSEKQISLGGVFLLRRGKGYYHVMPDFPSEDKLPFTDREQLGRWLTFHNFAAPMVCLTVFHSADPEVLGLRMEHTHCFSAEGRDEGGHYHGDLLEEEEAGEVEYEGYFNTVRALYRIDRPEGKM
ncbi:hypothetical protein LTR62_002455 [Meristemomyces frigidus]|uniref:DUF1907 domain-containing protein n=1 Tax=Meristemomyces frigidus TaxID=1508187 RepID=A0AAN7YQ86_9PEZI|nr:hypothetical protein LTR62_002455 [Meristemomyces frigidus]